VIAALLDHLSLIIQCDWVAVLLARPDDRVEVRGVRGLEGLVEAEAFHAGLFDLNIAALREMMAGERSILRHGVGVLPQSWIGAGIFSEGQLIGVCSAGAYARDEFTEEHRLFAEALAGQASVAMQNARLYREVAAGRERSRLLARQLVEVQESERRYLARNLHDDVGQALTSLLLGLRLLERGAAHPPAVLAEIAELRAMTGRLMENLHQMSVELLPASLDHVGLTAALRQYAEVISEKHGVQVQFEATEMGGNASQAGQRLAPDMEVALFRIVQEALDNAIRHSHVTSVDVLLTRHDDRVVIVVEDNGVGLAPLAADTRQNSRFALVGMQERAEMLGGTLTVEAAEGAGTTLAVEAPYAHSDRAGG
jgi:signal transduction histidine kinase